MVNRVWDKENRYSEGFLKEYRHWVLEVSYKQHTLGCYIIFAKSDIEKISELKDAELQELKEVMREIEEALLNIPELKPGRFNYFQMGNDLHHLHFHGVPRYDSPRKFAGRTWTDPTWGDVPRLSTINEDPTIVANIRDLIKSHLPK